MACDRQGDQRSEKREQLSVVNLFAVEVQGADGPAQRQVADREPVRARQGSDQNPLRRPLTDASHGHHALHDLVILEIVHAGEIVTRIQRGARDALDVLGLPETELELAQVIDFGGCQRFGAREGIPFAVGDRGSDTVGFYEQAADDPGHISRNLLPHDCLHQRLVNRGGSGVVVPIKILDHGRQHGISGNRIVKRPDVLVATQQPGDLLRHLIGVGAGEVVSGELHRQLRLVHSSDRAHGRQRDVVAQIQEPEVPTVVVLLGFELLVSGIIRLTRRQLEIVGRNRPDIGDQGGFHQICTSPRLEYRAPRGVSTLRYNRTVSGRQLRMIGNLARVTASDIAWRCRGVTWSRTRPRVRWGRNGRPSIDQPRPETDCSARWCKSSRLSEPPETPAQITLGFLLEGKVPRVDRASVDGLASSKFSAMASRIRGTIRESVGPRNFKVKCMPSGETQRTPEGRGRLNTAIVSAN